MRAERFARALLGALLWVYLACGASDDHESQRTSGGHSSLAGIGQGPDVNGGLGTSADAMAVSDAVRACKKAAQPASMFLLEGITYSGNLYPITQRACASCHRGDIENRENSTNCFYMRDNIDNLIKRLENAVDAAAFKVANPAATDQEVVNRYPQGERPMPQYGGNRQPLPQDEIDQFKAWRDQPNKCVEGEPPPESAEIPVAPEYSSDGDETAPQNLGKLLEGPACEDGPAVNSNENWAVMMPLLAAEANPQSAFYDFSKKEYVQGATAAPYECTFDGFIFSLGEVNNSIEPTLRAYEQYGWRMVQCAVVNGLPLASMATLSKIPNTLGDTILGINYKTITIEKGE